MSKPQWIHAYAYYQLLVYKLCFCFYLDNIRVKFLMLYFFKIMPIYALLCCFGETLKGGESLDES